MRARIVIFFLVLCCYLSVVYGIKCVQCSGNFAASQACMDNKTAQNCPKAKQLCYSTKWIVKTAKDKKDMTGFTRGCATVGIEPGCYKNADKVTVCTSYCTTEGCNTDDPGDGASSLRSSAVLVICALTLIILLPS